MKLNTASDRSNANFRHGEEDLQKKISNLEKEKSLSEDQSQEREAKLKKNLAKQKKNVDELLRQKI